MQRGGNALFGIHTIGVHMIDFCRDQAGEVKLWIPRRAATKQTWPGMLDNTVGGITTGEDQFECMVREAREEALLPEVWVRNTQRRWAPILLLGGSQRRSAQVGYCACSDRFLYQTRAYI